MQLIRSLLSAMALVLLASCATARKRSAAAPPKIDHILLEVADLNRSIHFYRDLIGLRVTSKIGHFVTLQSENAGVYLWSNRWDWEAPRVKGERNGLGMYPHFKVSNVEAVVKRAQQAGYQIVQKPRHYIWGTEAFVADPDGYIWAIIN